jgi:hypothetical protein
MNEFKNIMKATIALLTVMTVTAKVLDHFMGNPGAEGNDD